MFIETIYFFLPAGFANMAPVFIQKLPLLNIPLDGKGTLKGRRIFGDHKTVRGLLAGIILGTAVAYLQSFHFLSSYELVDYSNWLALGLLQSVGAMLGDAVKSFFKRQKDIPPGQSWFPYDQLDFIIGAILLTELVFPISLTSIMIAILLAPLFHMSINRIGHLLRIRDTPW